MNRWDPSRARQLIEDRGFTRRHVAKHVLLSYQSVNQILMGRKPGFRTLMLLAALLNTNMDYLTGKSDDPSPKSNEVA